MENYYYQQFFVVCPLLLVSQFKMGQEISAEAPIYLENLTGSVFKFQVVHQYYNEDVELSECVQLIRAIKSQ